MEKPVLVIMAAGMGSRYGGLKQIDPVDRQGHIIMDFSLYDARKAGFEKVVFILKKEMEKDFREAIGNRIEKQMDVKYVFQDIHDLPEGFRVPEGRVKPWGTGHAVLTACPVIHGPFAVINADDYYGDTAFRLIYDYLSQHGEDSTDKYHYMMVSYVLKNTLTENGYVSRGICTVSKDRYLRNIVERTRIIRTETGAAYSEDEGKTWKDISPESEVSMNMWGFTQSYMEELKERFPEFLRRNLPVNPMKCEFYIPSVVNDLLEEEKADVRVLNTPDVWFGVTYREDKQKVIQSLKRMKEKGKYPEEF